MNENTKSIFIIKNFLFRLLFWGGVIGIILLPFFSSQAVRIGTSVETLPFPAPTGLTATPVSSDRIDLSWFPSAQAVSYKVYRDGSLVGSPAATSFSDTGLNPGTTYSYTVSAVNTYGGESFQSVSVSATTLSVGAPFIYPPPPEIILEPIPEHPEIPKSLIINNGDVYTNSLKVTLTLSAKNAFQVAISNTADFAGISWESYQTTKNWTLTKGDGKKTVYAKFRSAEGGVSQVVSDSIVLDTTAPANISDFEAVPGDSQITLRWQNPLESDFKAVKILRSTNFYPAHPEEGVLVYDGKGISFIDTGLINGIRYYYTAFASDYTGNYASGAVVSAVPFKIKPPPLPLPEEITIEEECIEAGYYWYDDTCNLEPKVPPPPPEIEKLTLEDFDFVQEGKKLKITKPGKVKVGSEKPLTASISYQKVPEVLKTIMVTLEKYGKTFSFLLRINPEKTAFEATFLSPEEAGVYSLTLTILDYKNQAIKKISGQLLVKKPEAVPVSWCQKIINSILNWFKSIWNSISNWFQLIWQKICFIFS